MDEVAMERETRSSIEIDRNAKGDMSYKAKVYFDETDPVGRKIAQEKLQAIDAWFQVWYLPKTTGVT